MFGTRAYSVLSDWGMRDGTSNPVKSSESGRESGKDAVYSGGSESEGLRHFATGQGNVGTFLYSETFYNTVNVATRQRVREASRLKSERSLIIGFDCRYGE
jgi:hypothetical protein